jgi:hypothetical protein
MSPVAYLHVRRPSGAVDYFIADDCEIADGAVTVTGRFKRPSGRLEPRRSYSWPRGRIIEIRWTRERVIA